MELGTLNTLKAADLEEGVPAPTQATKPLKPGVPASEAIRIAFLFFLIIILSTASPIFREGHKTTALSFAEARGTNDFPGLDAYAQLTNIAQQPHPYGSIDNTRVFEYLLNTLQVYKNSSTAEMQIMVQDTHYFKQILVLFPGTTNSTVLFSAHFDSVPGSPGASDDGAAITVLLQLARLKSLSQTKSRNSFLLFFNNGEEIGLAGSEALLNSKNYTALVSNIKVFANFEGGGTGGKPILFRTTSSQLTQAYADLPYPHMSSFGGDLLGLLGSYTDYQNYVKAGIPGFDVAYYENRRFYHTPDDSLNNISPSDVQAMGSNALALSKTLLNAEWIDNLKIESKNAFYDHFGGYYPVLISPTFQRSLAGVLILFFIASLVYGYFYLYVPFKIPDSLVDPSIKSKKTYFGAHLLIFALYIVMVCFAVLTAVLIASIIPWVVSAKSVKSTGASWLMVSISLVSTLLGAWYVSGKWQKHYTDKGEDGPLSQDFGLYTFIGVLFACLLGILFTVFNFPIMYLLAFGAVARGVCGAILSVKRKGAEVPAVYEMNPVVTSIVFGTVFVVVTFYPLLMLTDFLMVMARLSVGTTYFGLILVLIAFPLSGAILSVVVHIKSDLGRKVLLYSSFGVVTVLTVGFVVLCFI
ncbi:hypothetical protein HDU79_003379 [Rhizoclosmatium sp. JEL0117]|nr:hypothetical protein HDU79_003379 [Rhizoclosmatium sp. JEL0117]